MRTCGCASDTLSSLLIIPPAGGGGMKPDFDPRGEAGLAERLVQVNLAQINLAQVSRSFIKLPYSQRGAP
jgi:hypothetical protein